MSISSIEFLIALMMASAIFCHLPGTRVRQAFLAICNSAVLYLVVPNLWSWLALAIFILSGYVFALVLRKKPNLHFFSSYLIILIGAFLFLKKYQFLNIHLFHWAMLHPVILVGLSYILFRQIHFIVDVMQQQIVRPTLWTYLNYQLNLFTLFAGPIQRYQDFDAHWQTLKPSLPDRHELLKAHLRILIGVIKLGLIATLCIETHQRLERTILQAGNGILDYPRWVLLLYFMGMFYVFPAYVYFNFSGYCDIVIAGGRLVGISLPENFDRPYLARNMIDYWNRWHRTLSFWVRDYIFMPIYKTMAERWPAQAQSSAILGFFAALFIAGVWHGSTMNWVIFGLLNGIGVSTAKLWEYYLIRRCGRKGLKQYLQSDRIRMLAIVANLHFACLTLWFFPLDLQKSTRILQIVWFRFF